MMGQAAATTPGFAVAGAAQLLAAGPRSRSRQRGRWQRKPPACAEAPGLALPTAQPRRSGATSVDMRASPRDLQRACAQQLLADRREPKVEALLRAVRTARVPVVTELRNETIRTPHHVPDHQ